MARPGRQADGIDSRSSAPWSRRGACGPTVRPDRCGDAAAAGHVARRRRQNARARLRDEECQSRGAGDQFARRFAGAVAPDLLTDSATRRGKETAGAGVRGGCRGIRRLHGRLRGRRDFLRSILDHGLDRRGRRLLWISGVDQKGRCRTAAVYGGGARREARDPFAAETPDEVARGEALQREIHTIFIGLVRQSRGTRLKGADDVLFTGEYWAGETSVSLGLADAVGDLRSTLRTRYGAKGVTPVIAPSTGLLSGLLGRKSAGAGTLSQLDGFASLPDELISALDRTAIWGNFG